MYALKINEDIFRKTETETAVNSPELKKKW